MIRKISLILIFILLISANSYALGSSNIEIFDIEKGCVIKNIESNYLIQKEVRSYLLSIKGFYGKFKPIPEKGFMIKVFLKPTVMIKNKFLKGNIYEVIIIIPHNEEPYLMVFDDKKRPEFYLYDGNIENLYNILKYNPKSTLTHIFSYI